MAINVTIPLEKLQDSSVSQALATLMLALGNDKRRPPVTKAAPKSAERPRRPRRRSGGGALPPAGEAPEAERFRAFAEGLPEPSRKFLQVLEERGKLTISQAMKELGLDRPKSLGGITGSITRWARDRDVAVPFESSKTKNGERLWRWSR